MLRRLLCCLSLAALFTLPSAAVAQRLEDGKTKFEASPEARDKTLRNLRSAFVNGRISCEVKEKAHQDTVNLMAAEHVYPIYWYGIESGYAPGTLNKYVEDWAVQLSYVGSGPRRDKTNAFQRALCHEVINRCVEVLKKSNKPIIAVNVAMLLARIPERAVERGVLQTREEWADDVAPRLTDGTGDHLATTCLDLLTAEAAKDGKKDRPNDGVRYYLFRTLASLLSVPLKKEAVKKENEEKAVQLAIAFVEKSRKPGANAPRAEQEGYKALRREALKVIAASRSADLGDKGKPALIAARFAAKDEGIKPAPRLDEQTESAMGLARMVADAAKSPGLQADYAAWCVLLAVYDFAVEANKEVEKKEKLERRRPWLIDASRLLEVIEAMKGDGKNAYVADVVKQCTAVLASVQAGSQAGASDLGQWEKNNRPTSKSVYKDEATSVVKRASQEKDE